MAIGAFAPVAQQALVHFVGRALHDAVNRWLRSEQEPPEEDGGRKCPACPAWPGCEREVAPTQDVLLAGLRELSSLVYVSSSASSWACWSGR